MCCRRYSHSRPRSSRGVTSRPHCALEAVGPGVVAESHNRASPQEDAPRFPDGVRAHWQQLSGRRLRRSPGGQCAGAARASRARYGCDRAQDGHLAEGVRRRPQRRLHGNRLVHAQDESGHHDDDHAGAAGRRRCDHADASRDRQRHDLRTAPSATGKPDPGRQALALREAEPAEHAQPVARPESLHQGEPGRSPIPASTSISCPPLRPVP